MGWCSERGCDPISGPISNVVNFLADLHSQGYQANSLNAYRSAISSAHDKVDEMDVGKHPLVARLLKGAFHARPPLVQYTDTWNVQVVLDCRLQWGDITSLSLKLSTYKLVMVMSLVRTWLKEVLKLSGFDTKIFTAHSTRSASSSAAADSGVTTNDILKAADWSSEFVFRKFYYRPTHNPLYGRAVLSKGSDEA